MSPSPAPTGPGWTWSPSPRRRLVPSPVETDDGVGDRVEAGLDRELVVHLDELLLDHVGVVEAVPPAAPDPGRQPVGMEPHPQRDVPHRADDAAPELRLRRGPV